MMKGSFCNLLLTCTHFLLLPTSLLCVFCFLISFYFQLLFVFSFTLSFTSYPTSIVSVFSVFFLLPLCFLLQHPPSSEFICFAEFRHVWVQLWHKAACDLVTSNLSLNHNETLSQTKSHHRRGISCMETIFFGWERHFSRGSSPLTLHSLQSPKLHLLQYKRMPNRAFWGGKK